MKRELTRLRPAGSLLSPGDGGTPSTRRSLPIALLRAREAVMQHFRPHLAELGLTEQQWRVLRVLGEDGPLEAGVVAQRACILPPSLSRILKTLSADGLIHVSPDSRDGRRTIAHLSDDGQLLLDQALPTSAAIYQRLEAAVGPEEWEALLDTLARLQTALSTAKDASPPSDP